VEDRLNVAEDLARLRRGEVSACEGLLRRYQNRLYRYLLRMVREPAAAEDLFQQTWLRVIKNIERYDPQRPFEPWLFSIARNLALDELRRRAPESLDQAEDRLDRSGFSEPDALSALLARERSDLLKDALGDLPAIYREVLTLRFDEEMKLEEIAEVWGAPVSTVKTRLQRALKALRRRLLASPREIEK
jgi:RNA polymerase sigma-70 factor (ECF subfamily)